MDPVADAGVPGDSGVLLDGRLRQRRVVDPAAGHRIRVSADMVALPAVADTGADGCVHRHDAGRRRGGSPCRGGRFDFGVRWLGGRVSPVVSGHLRVIGLGDARGGGAGQTVGARRDGRPGGRGRSHRRGLHRRGRTVRRLPQLCAWLGGELPARNRLAQWSTGRPPADTARIGLSCGAGRAPHVGPVPGQHDRGAGGGTPKHRSAVGGAGRLRGGPSRTAGGGRTHCRPCAQSRPRAALAGDRETL